MHWQEGKGALPAELFLVPGEVGFCAILMANPGGGSKGGQQEESRATPGFQRQYWKIRSNVVPQIQPQLLQVP